jgi:hypothetical protein
MTASERIRAARSEAERLRLHNLLTDALVQRERWNSHEDNQLYIYYDGKVSGLREALGLPIENHRETFKVTP